MMIGRREVLKAGAGAVLAAGVSSTGVRSSAAVETSALPFDNGERPLVTFPQKRKMIGLTQRPPQLETPFQVFDEGPITPNDAFFVRYHLADIPYDVDAETFVLSIRGEVEEPLKFSIADLKRFPSIELVAVNQCSGNSRGFFNPRVSGGQMGNGAMGNAHWKGVALKTVLDAARVRSGARQIVFGGMDRPVFDATPDFAKALDIDHALDGEVMLAYAMNNADLPLLNGYPLRLVVPGYFGTYWVKHLNDIEVINRIFDGYWMKSAYRIPDTPDNSVPAYSPAGATIPINRLVVRSFMTNVADGSEIRAGATTLKGIAFDGGSGIKTVAVSADGGSVWQPAELGPDLGRYSFRDWRTKINLSPGRYALKVQATANDGKTQPLEPLWNPSGYLRNVVETVRVVAV